MSTVKPDGRMLVVFGEHYEHVEALPWIYEMEVKPGIRVIIQHSPDDMGPRGWHWCVASRIFSIGIEPGAQLLPSPEDCCRVVETELRAIADTVRSLVELSNEWNLQS